MLTPSFALSLPMIRLDRYTGFPSPHPSYAGSRRVRMGHPLLAHALWGLLFCHLWIRVAHGDLADDKNGLTSFKQAADEQNVLAWNSTTDVCTWPGIECGIPVKQTTNRVIKLKLSTSRLSGTISERSLSQLTELRVINLKGNNLSGSLPSDLANCVFLRNIYLLDNRFSGPLPSNFSSWPNLGQFDVSNNNFSGTIPPSVAELTQLKRLYLQNNNLTGSLPERNIPTLTEFNVSNNHLNGSIPGTYGRFNESSFLGNSLCGSPLPACLTVSPSASVPPLSPPPPDDGKKLSGGAIAGIVIGVVFSLLILCAVCIFAYKATKSRRTVTRENPHGKGPDNGGDGIPDPKGEPIPVPPSSEPDHKGLVFLKGNKYTFELDDLLRASAEVLGKGTVGTSYKAVLESGTIVAVKRLKDVSVEKKDFDLKMVFFGNLKHENLVPVIAYYYAREEKLLVTNYMANGSLSALLHGNKEANSTPLDWDTRVRIALGVALGIQHLHDQDFIHGNIKSSNVLLTSNHTGCVSDYGLTQLVNASSAANRMVGYRAPEITDIRKPTLMTDVYSFGVLLLELLTGKPPSQPSMSEEGWNLPLWVMSVSRDEEDWYSKVFDPQLTRFEGAEDELEQVLNIALECVKPSPDQRPTMREVVEKLENYKQHDDGVYSS